MTRPSSHLAGAQRDPAKVDEYHEAGLDGMALDVTWDADLDTVRRELDSHAEFSERYLR